MKTILSLLLIFIGIISKSQTCNLTTFAGNDTLVCGTFTELNGTLTNTSNNCLWSSNDPSISFSNTNSVQTIIFTSDTCGSYEIYFTEIESSTCSYTDTLNICFKMPQSTITHSETISEDICNNLSYSTTLPPLIANMGCPCINNDFYDNIIHLMDSLQLLPFIIPSHWSWTGPTNANVQYGNNNDSTIYNPFNVTVSTEGSYHFFWVTGTREPDVQHQLDSLNSLLCKNSCDVFNVDIYLNFYIFEIDVNSVDIPCYENCTGQYNTVTLGGIPPFIYTQGAANEINLCEGTYQIQVIDNLGCLANNIVDIQEQHESDINLSSTNVTCFGDNNGSATVDILNYNSNSSIINWSNNEHTNTITQLPAGNYTVTVINDESCITVGNVQVLQPSSITVNEITTNENCYNNCDGACELNISGGVSPYTTSWSNGNTGNNISNLCNGDYFYTVTDNNGCYYIDSVHIFGADSMIYSFNYTPNICSGTYNGNIEVISPNISQMEFNWSNGSNNSQISNLCAGNYSVTITQNNNCPHIHNFNIAENEIVNFNIPNLIELCPNEDEQVTILPTSGVSPFIYIVNGDTTNNIFTVNSNNTNLNINIIDSNKCSSEIQTITVSTPTPLSATITTNSDSVCANSQITVNANIIGGKEPITITNQNGETIQFPYNCIIHNDTNLTFTITDACNQTITTAINIYVYQNPNLILSADNLSGCSPLEVNFNSSANNATWNINNSSYTNESTFNHTFTNPGTYTISQTITSSNNCFSEQELESKIIVHSNPIADFDFKSLFVSSDEVNVNLTNKSIESNSYLWNFNDGNTSETINPTHIFTKKDNITISLIATNMYGCKDTITKKVETSDEYTLFVPNAFTPNGNGVNKIFKPVYTGINTDRYHMYVFDRWGEKIWETDNAEIGWDGRAKGKSIVKNDVYTWLILFYDMSGYKHEKAGLVIINR